MSHGGMAASGPGHAVGFYELDSEGMDAVARFVASGWDLDECVVLVCTQAHRLAVDDRLVSQGYDPLARADAGRYLVLDAHETLRELLVEGHIDPEHFMGRVGEVLTEASAAGRPVRAFGEMVAILWEDGEVDAAIDLELLWNEILSEHEFSLLCAYPTDTLDRAELVDVRRVCDLHTDLTSTGSPETTDTAAAAGGHACSRVYLPTPESVPAARHFVVDVLRSWGHDELAADAALIVSELATNALHHAASPFRAVVDRRRGGLRIGVEDATRTPLERREAAGDDISGRGVTIVEALSRRWGYSPVPGGKVVWAELSLKANPTRAG
ncbi:MEDS domain-containing protein [Terrabacter sp. MAHUQ-38]|uniref:MEDS domain-containing protein n=1 Tax=unclassified Terrabacter TaxID=2630222 RepID=UPI00165D5466|nr:MEDS domain-containing protein [Terrabacter sp. MAHUQ-38]MBC9823883.1 MEDS domain-containing protein [Terrabacter sp. MAHUQ-38]